MLNIVCYKPELQHVTGIIALSKRPELRISAVLLDDMNSETASLCELAGLPILQPDFAIPPHSETTILAPDELLHSDTALRSRFAANTLVGYQEFLSPVPKTDTPRPAAAAARVEMPPQPVESTVSSVYQTLSRIEESLDRETLQPWLLALGIKALHADGGSLMLLDNQTRELYIAAAQGLLPDTIHDTRVAIGEGISGRVAANRSAELLLEPFTGPNQGRRDRSRILSAISAPMISAGQLLGVINVISDETRGVFTETDLIEFERITQRIAAILHKADGQANTAEGQLRRSMNDAMQSLTETATSPETELSGWAATVAMTLGAEQASIALLRQDGSLFIGEGSRDSETRVLNMDQYAPAWNDVFASGRTVIARQAPSPDVDQEMTILFLPLGDPVITGAFSICFRQPEQSHQFQIRSNHIVSLLNRRLQEFTQRHLQKAHIDSLKYLTTFLGEKRPAAAGPEGSEMAAALSALTGAATILRIDHDGHIETMRRSDSAPPPEPELSRRLLNDADQQGWAISTTLETDDRRPGTSVLGLALPDHPRYRGLILADKQPRHALDSLVFTDFDAGVSTSLIKAWPRTRPQTAPTPSEPPQAASVHEPRSRDSELLAVLNQEISRANRYHVVFSVSAIRWQGTVDTQRLHNAVSELADGLRDSDRLFLVDEKTLLIIAPEEAQSVTRLEKRCTDFLAGALNLPDDPFDIRRCVYPGRQTTPEAMLEHVLQAT
jgi:putative methionine-R-sulfoxide reductase with GAF domain